MAADRNTQERNREKKGREQPGRSGPQPGSEPRTSETAGTNNGGQTRRVTDQPRRKKQSGGR